MGDLPLACREFVELVTAYLEETLAAEERARFEGHLAECPHCRHYLEQMRLTIRLAGRLSGTELAPGEREDLLRCYREWTNSA